MSVGNFILLTLLALIGLRYCLAYNIGLSQELIETRRQLLQVQAERQALDAQYQSLMEEKNQLADQVSGMTNENEELRVQMKTLKDEQQVLNSQIEDLQKELKLIHKANPILAWFFAGPIEKVVAILLLPILPLSLGAAYIMTHAKEIRGTGATVSYSGQRQTTFQVGVTREELHLIALHRRSRRADERVA
jgi:hypothetical protein